jgi:hypothetical protein
MSSSNAANFAVIEKVVSGLLLYCRRLVVALILGIAAVCLSVCLFVIVVSLKVPEKRVCKKVARDQKT